MKNLKMNRRHFLRNTLASGTCAAAAYTASGMQMLHAAVPDEQDDYKALVCVFLFGGNDSHNMLVPLEGQARIDYQNVRGSLARTPTADMEIFPEGQTFEGKLAFVNEMSAVKALFDSKKLAIQGNVGSLIQPIFDENGNPKPDVVKPKGLFAHNAAQQNWMRGADLGQKATGWAGRLMDAYYGDGMPSYPSFLRTISVGGGNSWQTGINGRSHAVPVGGKIGSDYRFNRAWDNIDYSRQNLIDSYHEDYSSEHVLKSAFSNLYTGAVANNAWLGEQLDSIQVSHTFPATSLGGQLATVAKFIKLGKAQGIKRQVFFVSVGGFDTHFNQAVRHPGLLAHVSDAVASFYQFTESEGIQDEVTSFTMSDFGRAIRTNGNGTDHGWAGHQLITGGAVKGGKIYGDLPYQSASMSLIPTTSNEQMFASLARWYGFNDNSLLNEIFPNLRNFTSNDIDYFA